MAAIETTSFETWDGWLRAREAATLVGDDFRDHLKARGSIISRAILGEVSACAKKQIRERGSESAPYDFAMIPADWWVRGIAMPIGGSFWLDGDISFTLEDRSSMRARPLIVHCVDVRFEPSGIQALLSRPILAIARAGLAAQIDPPLATKRKSNGRPVGVGEKVRRPELKAWVAAYGAGHPGAPYGEFLASAIRHFHPRWVPQRPLRDVIAELKLNLRVGNPSILQK